MDRGTVGGGTANCVGGAVPRSATSWTLGGPAAHCTLHCTLQWAGRYGWVPGYTEHSWHSADKNVYTVQRHIGRHYAYSV